ncbi:MAG: acyltransferase [Alphaproteobacteria bacterium]|nr:acyltransferase [Alphaproteobacteria bacterium]
MSKAAALPPTLQTLQAGRGLAALIVVLFHLNGSIFGLDKYFPQQIWQGFMFGHAGVEYFFVLSGFIIAHIHWKDIGLPSRLRSFAAKRFVRIYPVYWLVLAVLLPIYFFVPAFAKDAPHGFIHLFGDLSLLPTPTGTTLVVAWTLKHEILFYAGFACLIAAPRFGIALMAVDLLGAAWVFAGNSVLPPEGGVPTVSLLPVIFSPLHFLFLYGALCAWAVRHGRVEHPWVPALAGIGIFLATGMYESFALNGEWTLWGSQLYGLGSALALLGFIELERSGHIKVPAFLILLGDASYGLYLIHFPLLSLLAKIVIAAHLPDFLPPGLIFVIMAAVAVAAGIVFHLLFEKPILRKLKPASRRKSPA